MQTTSCKASFIRGIQGTESLWLDFQLSAVDVPSRARSPEGNRAMVKPALLTLIIFKTKKWRKQKRRQNENQNWLDSCQLVYW